MSATESVYIYSEQFAPSVLPERSQECLKRAPKALKLGLHYMINYPPVLAEESTQLAFYNLKDSTQILDFHALSISISYFVPQFLFIELGVGKHIYFAIHAETLKDEY